MRLSVCLIVIFSLLSMGMTTVFADVNHTITCPTLPVDVSAVSSEDRSLVCDAAEKARAFFQSHGIEIKRQIRIRLHPGEIENHANHIGLYDSKKDHIDLVTLQHARFHCKEKSPFDVQMNKALYTSFVIHEVAHAIADQNFNSSPSSLIAPEYLAYVTQFSTMDEKLQQEILQRYQVPPFAGIEDMSVIYYELDPNAFALKAFRHFQHLTDKTYFVQGLLSGAIKPVTPQIE